MMIKHVIILVNGMVMVFDEKGKQIPEYQGFILEVAANLAKDCDKDTKFSFSCPGVPGVEVLDMDMSWWFINHRGQPPGM